MTLPLNPMIDAGFYITTSPVHAKSFDAYNLDSHPTIPEDDNLFSDTLQEDDKMTKQSTADEVVPDISRESEEVKPEVEVPSKHNDLENQNVLEMPPSLSKSEESNSEHVCTAEITLDPLGVNIPEDNNVKETLPVLPADLDHKESPILLDNSQNVIEVPPVDNSEDCSVKETPSDPVEDIDPANDATVETTLPFSPVSSSANLSEDSLTNAIYEKPDAADIPDGIVSMLCRRRESSKEEEMIQLDDLADSGDHCVITIISRRSRHRAGP